MKTQIRPQQIPKNEINLMKEHLSGCNELENLYSRCLLALFKNKKLFEMGRNYTKENILANLECLPFYTRLLESLLEMFLRKQYLSIDTEGKYFLAENEMDFDDKKLKENKQSFIQKYPFLENETIFLDNVLNSFLNVLSGKKDFITVMFPEGSFTNIENIYKNRVDSNYYNMLLGTFLENILKFNLKDPPKILEVGAGIGSTTDYVLSLIEQQQIKINSYCYTDISRAFIKYGQCRYANQYPFLSFKILNIENDPALQSFTEASYDILIAANVLHATRDISITLDHISKLLKPNGYLILNEAISKRDFSTIAFGLSPGCWTGLDSWRIPGTPFISLKNWEQLLTGKGFKNPISLTNYLKTKITGYQDIIIAQK